MCKIDPDSLCEMHSSPSEHTVPPTLTCVNLTPAYYSARDGYLEVFTYLSLLWKLYIIKFDV